LEGRITITQREGSIAVDTWPLGQGKILLALARDFITPELPVTQKPFSNQRSA